MIVLQSLRMVLNASLAGVMAMFLAPIIILAFGVAIIQATCWAIWKRDISFPQPMWLDSIDEAVSLRMGYFLFYGDSRPMPQRTP